VPPLSLFVRTFFCWFARTEAGGQVKEGIEQSRPCLPSPCRLVWPRPLQRITGAREALSSLLCRGSQGALLRSLFSVFVGSSVRGARSTQWGAAPPLVLFSRSGAVSASPSSAPTVCIHDHEHLQRRWWSEFLAVSRTLRPSPSLRPAQRQQVGQLRLESSPSVAVRV
jgi:hypothetical protein